MTCKNCGKEFQEGAFCPYCGSAQFTAVRQNNDAPSGGYAVLCFFIPIVGLILYLVWKDEYPLRAKSCGKGALIAVIVYAVLAVIYVILLFVIIAIAAAASGSATMGLSALLLL